MKTVKSKLIYNISSQARGKYIKIFLMSGKCIDFIGVFPQKTKSNMLFWTHFNGFTSIARQFLKSYPQHVWFQPQYVF